MLKLILQHTIMATATLLLLQGCSSLGLDKLKLDGSKTKDNVKGSVSVESAEQDTRAGRMPRATTAAPSQKNIQTSAERDAHPADRDIDFSSQPSMPTVLYESCLNGNLLLLDPVTGDLRINKLHVGFLPTKTKDGTPLNYRATYTSEILTWIEIYDTKQNKPIDSIYFEAADYIIPFRILERKDYAGMLTKLYEGNFELRFKLVQNEFFRFPFRVEWIANSDPYSPVKGLFFMRGAWEDWGFISYNSDKQIRFSFFTTERRVDIKNQSRPDEATQYEYLAKLLRDGKPVGASHVENDDSKEMTWQEMRIENAHWETYEGGFFVWPVGGNRRYMTKEELKDGNYTIDLTLRHKENKTETYSKYAFVVKNGKIVPDPKADRNQNKDYLTFLEQGTAHNWIRKIK